MRIIDACYAVESMHNAKCEMKLISAAVSLSKWERPVYGEVAFEAGWDDGVRS